MYVVQPAPGRVAVKLTKIQEQTEGRIWIPDTARDVEVQGTVYASCAPYSVDGEDYEPLYLPGDLVLFGPYSGTRITVGRDVVVVLKETDIIARIVEVDESSQPSAGTLQLIKVTES